MQQQRSYVGNAPSSYIPPGGGGESPPISRGPAEIIPFPVVARVGFLDRTAELAASYRDPSKYLASVYRQQESSLRRCVVAPRSSTPRPKPQGKPKKQQLRS